MVGKRPTKLRERVAHHSKRAWSVVRWTFGAALTLLALPNIPDEISRWERLLADMMADPRIHAVASWLAEAAHIHNEVPVRLGLGAAGLLLLAWGWRPIWRFRHRLLFRARRLFVTQVWISEGDGTKIILTSSWAYARKTANDNSIIPWIPTFSITTSKTRTRQTRDDMFIHWCEMALRTFAAEVPTGVRSMEGKTEIDETALREWIQGRFGEDLIKEFGKP